jgi:hypothetical protein
MRIIEVTYQRKINTGNYENVCIGAKAELGPNDNPQEVWSILKDNVEMWWVDQQKPKPVVPVVPQVDPLKCPKCGGTKKPQFPLCYRCQYPEGKP